MRLFPFLAVRLFACASLLVASALPAAAQSAADRSISAQELRAIVETLAADEMRGRLAGSAECARAGEYLARELERARLEPMGDDGSFLQAVPMHEVRYETQPTLRTQAPGAAPDGRTPDAAPSDTAWLERAWSVDFEALGGVPAAGALRLVTATKAEELPAEGREQLALFVDLPARERRLLLNAIEGSKQPFGLLVIAGSSTSGKAGGDALPRPDKSSGTRALPMAQIRARGEFLAALKAGLVSRLTLSVKARAETLRAFNVVGGIRAAAGSPHGAAGAEAIVFSAHYDHIGVAQRGRTARAAEGPDAADQASAPSEDLIFNGADDDASGCATVLALARALSGTKPKRTLIFLFATGEEIGLVGTHAFLAQPPVALERIVCNLNFEMLGRPDPKIGGVGKLWLTGDERSNLGARLRELGLEVVPDPYPEQHFFERSDSIAFAHKGIVGQTLSSYNLHSDYHAVSDAPERLDYEHMRAVGSTALACARALADGRVDPAWNEGGRPPPR